MTNCLNTSLMCLSLLLLTACGSYDFTVNEKVVYTPDPLFTDYDIPDAALHACVEEAINSDKVTSARGLVRLNCANAGIETLAGLATFTELEQVSLSSNNIRDIDELGSLTVLQVLYLDDNQVISAVPLYQLPALYQLDLSGNSGLLCPQPGSLMRVATLALPEHCR
jgi:hypothetical protein